MSFFAAASPSPELLLLPPPLLVNCTFKWKIFGSQQKHCIQKRQSRSYSNTEEIVPGKLPFGRSRKVFWWLFWGFFLISRLGFEELHRTAGAEGRWQPLFAEERFQRKYTSKGEGKLIQCAFCTQIKTKRPPPHNQTKTARRNKARGGGKYLCFHQGKKFALLSLSSTVLVVIFLLLKSVLS